MLEWYLRKEDAATRRGTNPVGTNPVGVRMLLSFWDGGLGRWWMVVDCGGQWWMVVMVVDGGGQWYTG